MTASTSPRSWRDWLSGRKRAASGLVGAAAETHGDADQTNEYVEHIVADTRLMSSCRELRVNLACVSRDGHAPGLLVAGTSSTLEGADTVLALALSMAEVSPGTALLVDADLRNPTLHQRLGLARTPGFTDVLAGKVEESTAIRYVGHGLGILTSGTHDADLGTLLARDSVAGSVERLTASHPYLVFTSPPCPRYPDASFLAPLVGSVVMQIMVGYDTQEDIRRCMATLVEAGGAMRGFVAVMRR